MGEEVSACIPTVPESATTLAMSCCSPTSASASASAPVSPADAARVAPRSAPAALDKDPQPPLEELLVSHLRFAHAFKKNDAAQILQFLDKHVVLRSVDGTTHEGQSAVLAYLVGARMSKLSANLAVKGCPTRSGAWQSSFVYEHGLVFKDPLFIEVLDWTPAQTVTRIAHVPLPDAKQNKSFQEFLKSSPLSQLRLSFGTHSDSDDNSRDSSPGLLDAELSDASDVDSATPPSKLRCRRSKSTGSADSRRAAQLRLSGSSSSGGATSQSGESPVQPMSTSLCATADNVCAAVELAEITCLGLSPVRKRRSVNPFVVLRCTSTDASWKSPVRRREPNPRWGRVPLRVPMRSESDVLEISLWDHSLFHSVKVASAALVLSDLLQSTQSEFSTTVELERLDTGGNDRDQNQRQPPVQLQLRFVRSKPLDVMANSSEEEHAVWEDIQHLSGFKREAGDASVASSALRGGLQWLLAPVVAGEHASVALMLARALVVAALVFLLFHGVPLLL